MAAMRCRKMSRFSTGSRRAAFITILSWILVRPIMGRMMPQLFARCKKMWLQPPQKKAAPIRGRGFLFGRRI